MCLGDGLTADAFHGGFGSQLEDTYHVKADIIKRGLAGYHTSWLVYLTPYLFTDLRNLLGVIFFLGVKDTVIPSRARVYTTPKQFRDSYEKLMLSAHNGGCVPYANMILVTPPPICDTCQNTRKTNHTALYVAEIKSLATKYKAQFLDIFTIWPATNPNWLQYYGPDGLHLSVPGHTRLREDIVALTQKSATGLDAKRLPRYWTDTVSETDPGASLKPLADSARGTARFCAGKNKLVVEAGACFPK